MRWQKLNLVRRLRCVFNLITQFIWLFSLQFAAEKKINCSVTYELLKTRCIAQHFWTSKSKQWLAYCAQCLFICFDIQVQAYFIHVHIFCKNTTKENRWKKKKKHFHTALCNNVSGALTTLVCQWIINEETTYPKWAPHVYCFFYKNSDTL